MGGNTAHGEENSNARFASYHTPGLPVTTRCACTSPPAPPQVTAAEGFGKRRLFEIMDDLERSSRPIMDAARERVARDKGEDALQPWNISYKLAGQGGGKGARGRASTRGHGGAKGERWRV